MTLYGSGKIQYMLAKTVVTNVIYHTIFYILFKTNVWTPTLTSIALMFGGGCAFDAVISCIAYVILLKRENIHFLELIRCKIIQRGFKNER